MTKKYNNKNGTLFWKKGPLEIKIEKVDEDFLYKVSIDGSGIFETKNKEFNPTVVENYVDDLLFRIMNG